VQSSDALASFHPLVAGWFRERFGEPTAPQRAGWPAIAAGRDTLIAAPTGSGKTLAAFLACLDALVVDGLRAPLPDRVHLLYISPLKALSNDVHRNLSVPLAELQARAARDGVALPAIEVGVRTGDTKRPPHILVTTPESVYILLTTARGRAALGQVRTVIVDEIHAIAGDKRGAHLALSLERLDRLVTQTTGQAPVRVGLSATQRPIERIAALLGGRRPTPVIVDAGHRRDVDLAIEIPDDELAAVASKEQMAQVYDRMAVLVAASTAPRSSSPTPAAWPSASATPSANASAPKRSPPTTAASPKPSASTPNSASKPATSNASSPPPRSNSASTSATSSW
jgi:ATP-dependent Lhr-like helicase